MEIYKLGKLPYKNDLRTLHFEDYFTFPEPPEEKIWYDKVSKYGMMLNDKIGDCAIAGPAHMIQTWTANSSNEIIIPDDKIVETYSAVSGYDPKTGANDHGCVLLDVLKYWKNTGIDGHKIGAFASVNPRNIRMIKIAIQLFGGVLNGIALPLSAQGQDSWDIAQSFNGDGAPGSWGGHCTATEGYNELQDINITWGTGVPASWSFMQVYCDERWVVFSDDFINRKGFSPNGFNREKLLEDLTHIS